MKEFTFHLHKDKWVLSPVAIIGNGFGYVAVPPVVIIDWGDKAGLVSAIQTLLSQPFSVVGADAPILQEPLGVGAKAVGAKTPSTFVRDTRCFSIENEKNHLRLEEWTKVRGGWDATPVWKKVFLDDQLEELINFLMKKTKPESSSRNSRAGSRTRKTKSG